MALRGMVIVLMVFLLCAAGQRPGRADALSPLVRSAHWLNGRVSESDVHGKVVLVDFYTFGCINCKHVEPNLRALYRSSSRADLVILGVHSPETAYERDAANVIASFREQGVRWPVALDNDFALWNDYGIQAWPTQLIFDRRGVLRRTIVGEGQDRIVNDTVAQLSATRSRIRSLSSQ